MYTRRQKVFLLKYSHDPEYEEWKDKNVPECMSSELCIKMRCYDKKRNEMCTIHDMKRYVSRQIVRVRTCRRSICIADAMYEHWQTVTTIKLYGRDEGMKCTHV